MRPLFHRLRRDRRGVTIVEFAYIAPFFMVMLMGAFDLGYRTYVHNIVQGEAQRAARAGTLEGGAGTTTANDARVKNQAGRTVANGTWSFQRKFYPSFTRAGQQENFTDGNNNGIRDAGECFQDENGNGTWDSNSGRAGQGGADDIVVYTASVNYPRLFPMYGLLGWSSRQTVSATTVLRNQPFGDQVTYTPVTICS